MKESQIREKKLQKSWWVLKILEKFYKVLNQFSSIEKESLKVLKIHKETQKVTIEFRRVRIKCVEEPEIVFRKAVRIVEF